MPKTIKELRNELGAYLTKALQIDSGVMTTQQNVGVTSLSSGGLEGQLLIRENGEIIQNDGTNNRVKIGDIS